MKIKEILQATKGKLIQGNEEEEINEFCRDTRIIKEGDAYIGIKGENFDGNTLWKNAFENGASTVILQGIDFSKENLEKYQNENIIVVEDTIEALADIATYRRMLFGKDFPVIGVTGSVGKTSTKDIIANVVSQKYKTLKTQGNNNNNIGLPFTIFNLKDQEAAVIEMGMNHFGEISKLTKIAKPTISVITNIGTSHIGNLGSRENILKAKLEILEGMKIPKIIINNDNDLLHKWYLENKQYQIVTYGINNDSSNMAENIEYNETGSKFVLKPDDEQIDVPVGGEAFVYNSLAAISVGKLLNIPLAEIKEGIKKFELSKMRLDIQKTEQGYTIINDCYNANYDSMKSAIEYLKNIEGKRKVAVLGDMLELGEYSKELHEKVGLEVAKNKIDILITVGKEAENIARVAKNNGVEHVYTFDNNKDATEKLKKIIAVDDVALIKASNSMNFKEIVASLLQH